MILFWRSGPRTPVPPVDWSKAPWPIKVLHGIGVFAGMCLALAGLIVVGAMVLGALGIIR